MKDHGAAPRLELRGASKTFGETKVLHNVSLDIAAGEVHSLVGQNGSGKSTLIKILAGFHTADSGASVLIDGKPRTLGDPDDIHAAGVRFVHQDLGLVPSLSVVDNLALGHGYTTGFGARINWRDQALAARAALERVGYDLDVRKIVDELEPIERTAVAIARALQSAADDMSVLVLDEPTATMPNAEVHKFFSIVETVRKQGIGILYVSHHLDEIFELSDRMTILVDGKVAATRKREDITQTQLVDLMTGGTTIEPRSRPTPDVGEPLLSLKDVSGDEVSGVDLEVHAGEIVGVAGISGSGREELCSLIFGAKPRTGQVTVLNHRIPPSRPDTSASRGVALVPANRLRDGINIGLNVRENFNLTTARQLVRFGRISPRADQLQASTLSRMMSVRLPSIEAPIETLSGGNQQKVVLGKWLQTRPSVLLLDEPTQGVDIAAKAELHNLIEDAATTGVAVLVCSSDEAELQRLCDRVLVLRHGRIVSEFKGAEIKTRLLVQTTLGITTQSEEKGTAQNGHEHLV